MHRMTSTQARHTRRAVLQAAVDAGARCTGADPDLWFRGDDEPDTDWQTRRTTAQRICAGCPARAACEELALRNDDGEPDVDDLVRAGYTGPELAAIRTHQERRLAAAAAADQDTDGRQLRDLTVLVQTETISSLDKRQHGTRRSPTKVQKEQNHLIGMLTARINEIRTARRARAGWGVAA
ncbi:WhiB family transcriptional regulator [Streptomyces sp. NPDC002466]|uniref:WhiB family transcriptional regulator n=1 Tax=unclassified Streptomyces TaxID=2593676 RepID=UPI003326F206